MRNPRPSIQVITEAYAEREGRDDTAAFLRHSGYSFSDTWFSQQLDGYYGRSRSPNKDSADPANAAFDEAVLADPECLAPNSGYAKGWTAEDELSEIEEDEDLPVRGVIESADVNRLTTDCKTFVFTSAQNNTKVHGPFLEALRHFCEHNKAELHISQFTYNKGAFGKKSVKPGSEVQEDKLWFDPEIAEFVSDVSIQLAPDLVWCGELNIIPTMKFPLTQFQGYTRQSSAIIPHVKMAMDSLPTMKGTPAKMLYSTGTVTQRNYVERTAGQVADFHHVFGAIIVEVDDDYNWWVRQINATNDGSFYDLTTHYNEKGSYSHMAVEAVTHGDIHWDKRDQSIIKAVFEEDGILDQLRPTVQFFHDIVDFKARNHHNIKDGHFLHEMQVSGHDNVMSEFKGAGQFLGHLGHRDWLDTYVITSNHDQAIELWLRNPLGMTDSVNARFWHEVNLYCHEMIAIEQKPRPFGYALMSNILNPAIKRIQILHEDDSYLILGKIEAGLHGHLGPNGARGSPKNLRTVGKANTGHTHTAGIVDGVYTCGLYAKMEMGYNKGLSSWSHSLIVTYPNAKRAILTIKNGKAWR